MAAATGASNTIDNSTEYSTLKKLIETGMIADDVPTELFKESRASCNKVFSSISKFYSHLRIHCEERPYVCPMPHCGQGFNQKGNL